MIENNNEPKNEVSKSTTSDLSVSTYLDTEKLTQIELLVDKLKDSALASQFIDKKYEKNEDGSIIESSEILIFNRADMIMCLGLGAELGMSPFVALSYGKSLNLTSIKKIEKGKKMGLDYNTSLEQIYVWGSGSKEIVYTSIHIVNAVLTRAGVKREIIQDGTVPHYYCTEIASGKSIEFDTSIHYEVPRGLPAAQLKQVIEAIKNDKQLIPVYKDTTPTFIGEVKLSRFNKFLKEVETVSLPYSSKQAIEAGLYRGINSDGEVVKGKDNWNAHVATHLLKMSIMNGGRMIAADYLQGIYDESEISIIKEKSNDTSAFEEAEIV